MLPAQPAVSFFRHLTHRLRDPEEFGLALSGVRLKADFLGARQQPTQVEQFQTTGWMLDFHEAHVKARLHGPLPPGWVSLGLMRGPAESSWYGIQAPPGTLVCNPPGVPIDGCITPGFSCAAVNVPIAVWEQCRALAGAEPGTLTSFTTHQLSSPQHDRIERELRALHHQLRPATHPRPTAETLFDTTAFVTRLVTAVWEMNTPQAWLRRVSLFNRARLARRAEAWMRDHLSEPVQVPDVCLALRVSRRELEYAFRSTFDQSPRDHLHALRLNAIRRALRHRSADSVTRAALDHGITHLGRFAGHYRRLFGEAPAVTLGR